MKTVVNIAQREKQRIETEILNAAISTPDPSLNKDELCKALVAQYLSHDGYVETARAFATEIRGEATALRGQPDAKLEQFLSVEEDQDAVNRQRMSNYEPMKKSIKLMDM